MGCSQGWALLMTIIKMMMLLLLMTEMIMVSLHGLLMFNTPNLGAEDNTSRWNDSTLETWVSIEVTRLLSLFSVKGDAKVHKATEASWSWKRKIAPFYFA